MDQRTLYKLAPDIQNILLHDKDFSYVTKYKYSWIEPMQDTGWAALFTMINNDIIPDDATAEELAHYIIAVLTGIVAVDLYLKHLVNNHIDFEIQDRKGYIDKIFFRPDKPAVIMPDRPEIHFKFWNTISHNVDLVDVSIRFAWMPNFGYNATDYEYLDQMIGIRVAAQSTGQVYEHYCKVKELNSKLVKSCLDKIRG